MKWLGYGRRTVDSPLAVIIAAGSYSPITVRIWPMVCIPRIRLFLIFIKYIPPNSEMKIIGSNINGWCASAARRRRWWTAESAPLWFRSYEPPWNQMDLWGCPLKGRSVKVKVLKNKLAGTAPCCPQRGGIIASDFPGKKWDYWLLMGEYWLLWMKYEPNMF